MTKKAPPSKSADKGTDKKAPSHEWLIWAKRLKFLSCFLGLLLIISVFKNIAYPLFWADESMTAMCSERVVKYGYPKAHDGKNVLNDMYCPNPKIAVNEKDDAFIGGANWGQDYFGTLGYLLAGSSDDVYTQTGIFRSTFAIMGLLGIFLMAFVLSIFFEDNFYKYLFISLFLLAELISVSLVLHIRQVRYYPLALFFSSSVICLYSWYRFHKPFNKIIYSIVLAVLLWIMFNIFSPSYFILIFAIGISEAVIALFQYLKINNLKEAAMPCLPALAAIVISYIGIYPLLVYFKTFEMKKMLDDFYHHGFPLYELYFSAEFRYFRNLELFWLAVAMRAGILLNYKKIINQNSPLFRISNFFSLIFLISLFSIPNISNSLFTRYFIYMQPLLSVIAILDFILLLKILSPSSPKGTPSGKNARTGKIYLLLTVFAGFFIFTAAENLPYINGHVYEMTHQYKGPLDYTIPFIKSTYPKPGDLTIATNYEETSYMYYLKSKVIVGFVGNNLAEDSVLHPDIISFRQSLGSYFPTIFATILNMPGFNKVTFPAKDIILNNVPELNFDIPEFDHYFTSPTTDIKNEEVYLLIKK